MPGLATATMEGDAVTRLIAKAARRLSASSPTRRALVDDGADDDAPPFALTIQDDEANAIKQSDSDDTTQRLQWPRDSMSPRGRRRNSSDAGNMQAPFRRSLSQPENPTSDMGELAIAEETSALPHSSGQKLVLLRRFSVSEQDVVICNRVRCGVDPSWFRHRSTGHSSRRYLRSLSVEEARLAATRRRMGLTSGPSTSRSSAVSSTASSRRSSGLAPMPFVVPENESMDDPALISADIKHLTSPRSRVASLPEADEEDEDQEEDDNEEEEDELPRYAADMGPAPLTPREKAMHGRYLIRESFANGSYGQVCAGEDNASHQEVAVKIIPKYILVSPEEKQSVIREQIIHKSLNHPHIIKLIDVFEDEGAHYFILERADNGSLSTLITYAGMPEEQARDVFRQLLQALQYLHLNNIVHHDIKPNNILLQKGGGEIKLCDFGASRAFNSDEASLPFAGVFGTPGYIAPELLMGENAYGPAIDMFSAGILLFEMVFGYTPFYPPSACTYQPLDFPPRAPVTDDARDMISRLLEKDPQQRITASQALGHPWITRGTTGRSAPNSPVPTPKRLLSPRSMTSRPLMERCMSCI